MANVHKRYLSSISSPSGPSNALSNSTLLDDETPISATLEGGETGGPPPKPPPEQRILLLQALLAIGDLPASLLLLGRFPWVAQSHPHIADLIMRIVAYAVEDVYKPVTGIGLKGSDEDDLDMEEIAPTAKTATKEVIPTLLAPCPPATTTKVFKFFYPDWREGLEKWTTAEEVLEKGPRWLSLVRGLGGRTVKAMVKICRIGDAYFTALRRSKEADLDLQRVAKSKEEIRMVEVGRGPAIQADSINSRRYSRCSPGSTLLGHPCCQRYRHRELLQLSTSSYGYSSSISPFPSGTPCTANGGKAHATSEVGTPVRSHPTLQPRVHARPRKRYLE